MPTALSYHSGLLSRSAGHATTTITKISTTCVDLCKRSASQLRIVLKAKGYGYCPNAKPQPNAYDRFDRILHDDIFF